MQWEFISTQEKYTEKHVGTDVFFWENLAEIQNESE